MKESSSKDKLSPPSQRGLKLRTKSNNRFIKCFQGKQVEKLDNSSFQPKLSYEELLHKTKSFLVGRRKDSHGEKTELNLDFLIQRDTSPVEEKKERVEQRPQKMRFLRMNLNKLIKIEDRKGI